MGDLKMGKGGSSSSSSSSDDGHKTHADIELHMKAPGGHVVNSGVSAAGGGSAFALNLAETLDVNGTDYLYEAPNCCDSCWLMCCPCRPFFQYTSDHDKYIFFNPCVCCCQDWKVEHVAAGKERGEGKVLGGTTAPCCCENGCMYCFCPCCTCSGNAVLQKLYHHEKGNDKYTIRQRLFCCWTCAGCCAPCGMCFRSCGDCCAYCGNNNYVITTEKLYPAADENNHTTKDLADIPDIGKLMMADRIECCGCCPVRVPVKYATILDEAGDLDNEMAPVVGILLQIFRGVPVPCKLCTLPPVAAPMGVSCLDVGRSVATIRCEMKEMMELTDSNHPAQLKANLEKKHASMGITTGSHA